MQTSHLPNTTSTSQYIYKSYEDLEKRLSEVKIGGRISDQSAYYSGSRGSTYDRSSLYSAKLLCSSTYSRQSYSSDQPFNHVSLRPTNLPTLDSISEVKRKQATTTLAAINAYNRYTLSTDKVAASNRTTSRYTEGISPRMRNRANYIASKQQDLSVSWLSESENFEEYAGDGAEQFPTQEAMKDDDSVEESVILFSARNYEGLGSFAVSEMDPVDNKSLLGSFVDTPNSIYIFNTNSSLKP